MTKEIPLTKGKVALVDDEDFEWLSQFKWFCDHGGYAGRNIRGSDGKWKNLRMHRAVMNTPEGMDTDHINHDTLDNRRSNLRICTTPQNMGNRNMNRNNTNGFKGITFLKKLNKWMAQIQVNGRHMYLGIFEDPSEAGKAYDEAAKKYFGEFSRRNFNE